jgi:hypothetical protein
MKRILMAILLLVVALPLAGLLTWMLMPIWNWVESSLGIESVGHSGPAGWCYYATLGLILVCGVGIAFWPRKE